METIIEFYIIKVHFIELNVLIDENAGKSGVRIPFYLICFFLNLSLAPLYSFC